VSFRQKTATERVSGSFCFGAVVFVAPESGFDGDFNY